MCRRFFGLLGATALVLSSGCEFWSEVTVPAADSTPPMGVTRLHEIGGEGLDLFAYTSGETVNYVTSDRHRTFVAVAAAWDQQGARRVRMYHGATRTCANGDIGASQQIHMAPLEAQQSGGPGDVVDTGVWTGRAVSMREADNCPGATELVSYTYWWSAQAENFSGQVVDGAGGSITFVP